MNADNRRSNFVAALLGALVIAIPFGGLAAGGAFDSSSDGGAATLTQSEPDSSSSAEPAPVARAATDVSALYERVSQGVVSIEVRSGAKGGTGSGFVVDDEGHIVTNQHVVAGASTVRVRFSEGGAPVQARVLGADAETDLAVLKVDPGKHDLTPLALGSSKTLKVGQPAIAIGSPFRFEGSLTTGIISAIGRSINSPAGFPIDDAVQTDAAINPGNSGGPLLDASGRVIGVNAQIASTSGANDGIGFAIPIDTVKDVLPALKAGREIDRPYLGVSTSDPTTGTGALVRELVRGGPAAKAGLRAGDRIVAIGDSRIERSTDVSPAIVSRKPGDEVQIKLSRGGKERTETVTLGTRPERSGSQSVPDLDRPAPQPPDPPTNP